MKTHLQAALYRVVFLSLLSPPLGGSALLFAQTNVGQILGTVRDASGAVVPNADVKARNVLTGVENETKTTTDGTYRFASLPTGEYEASASASGFKTFVRAGIHVAGAEAITVDFRLEVGQASQSVQVIAHGASIDTTTTTSGTTILSTEIEELPLLVNGSSRSGLSLISVLPGVNGGQVGTINGGPEGGVSYMLDGTIGSSAGHTLTGDSYNMAPEGLSELKLSATNDSQYGANSGIVISAVTKSGTNTLHGDFWWYTRRGFLNAACYYCAGVADPANQNEEGFTIGGPVYLPHLYDGRNKTFFFANWGDFTYRTTPGGTLLTVPTALMREGNFSEWTAQYGPTRQIYDPNDVILDPAGSGTYVRAPFPGNIIPPNRLNKTSQYYQGFFPMPDLPGLVNNWRGTLPPGKTDDPKELVKIDQNLANGRQRLSVAWDLNLYSTLSPGDWSGPLATGYTFDNYAYRVRVDWQMSLGTNKLLSLRGAINRNYDGNVTAPNALATTGGSAAGITNQYLPYTPQTSMENESFGIAPFAGTDGNTQDILPLNADLSWSKGKHNVKFGFSFVNNTLVNQDCFGCAGYAIYGGLTASGLAGSIGQGYADFALGTPYLYIMNSSLYTKYLNNEWGWYGEDSWRVTRKLTADFGARLDVLQPPHEAHDRISYTDLSIPNIAAGGLLGARSFFGTCQACDGLHRVVNTQHPLSPHFGLAYQLRPTTVLRASFGTSTVNLLGLFESGVQLALGGGSAGYSWTGVGYFGGVGTPTTPPKVAWGGAFDVGPAQQPPLPDYSSTISNGGPTSWWDPFSFRAGRSENISAGIEQMLPHSILLKVGYVGNMTHDLPVAGVLRGSDINPSYITLGNTLGQAVGSPAAIAAGINAPYPGFSGTVAQALSPYPQFLGVSNIAQSFGESLYHALQTTVQKRYGDMTFLVSYTFSKQLDNYNTFAGLGEGYQENAAGNTQNDAFVSKYKHLGNIDIPQVLVLSWVYKLPFGPEKRFLNTHNPVLGQIVGGWRVAAIQTYESGGVLQVSQSNDGIPGFGQIWATRVPGVPTMTGIGCGNYDPGNPAKNTYLNVAAFTDPGLFTLGNTQVLPNTRPCGYLDEDVSLRKEVKLYERLNMELAAEATNLFNRHLWTGLATNIDVSNYGQYTGTTGPRLMQLHIKLTF